MPETTTWPAGWFPDPTGRHDHRWWDGGAWTAHVADAGIAGLDPLPDASPAPGALPTAAGTATDAEVSSALGGTDAGAVPAHPSAPVSPIAPVAPTPSAPGTGRDPVAVAALVVGIVGLVLSFVPGFGLVLPIAAIVLGVLGRSRIRRSARDGDGMAIAGLSLGVVGLTIALIVGAVALWVIAGSGSEIATVFAEYMTCLETQPRAECDAAFEEAMLRILG